MACLFKWENCWNFWPKFKKEIVNLGYEDEPINKGTVLKPRSQNSDSIFPRSANSITGNVYKCSGSLINRRYVITAAHCHTEGTFPSHIFHAIIVINWNIFEDSDNAEYE